MVRVERYRRSLWPVNGESTSGLTRRTQQSESMHSSAAIEDERAAWCEHPSARRQGSVLDVVENDVVRLPALREVLAGVVDHVRRADRPNQAHICRTAIEPTSARFTHFDGRNCALLMATSSGHPRSRGHQV